jgi:hypothetical protein
MNQHDDLMSVLDGEVEKESACFRKEARMLRDKRKVLENRSGPLPMSSYMINPTVSRPTDAIGPAAS